MDSGVLIAATRVTTQDAGDALALLTDPGRIFITSPFVFLEVVPKAIYFGMQFEREVYDRYFENAQWYRDLEKIEETARHEAIRTGLGAMDSLHVAAAYLARADDFITMEKPAKAIHRSSLVNVRYLFG